MLVSVDYESGFGFINTPSQVKLPMLLAKPKKDYKSVSKTELMKETLDESEKEVNPSEEAFNIFDEIKDVCEKVGDKRQ